MRVQIENLPADLRRMARACPYQLIPKVDKDTGEVKLDERTGQPKYDKKPTRALPGGHGAHKDNPTHFTTIDAAVEAQEKYGYDGIGVSPSFSHIACCDIDGCVDENGEPNDFAKDVMAALPGAYWELSPSARGIRGVFLVDDDFHLDQGKYYTNNRMRGMEVYCPGEKAYYVTLTGNALNRVDHLPNLTSQLCAALDRWMLKPARQEESCYEEVGAQIDADERDLDELALDAAEVRERIKRSKDADTFARLGNGDNCGKPSDSEADLHFCGIATFYSQKDATVVDYLFRHSERMRPKWDEMHGAATYGCMTIGQAFADHKTVWSPDYRGESTRKAPLPDDAFAAFGFYSIPDLTEDERRPPEFIIGGMIPVGLTFLSGAPKTRKSFLALQMAIAVAQGNPFFGRETKQCDVVYLDLEGSKSRISARTSGMVEDIPRNLLITNSTAFKLADGLVDMLRRLHQQRPSIRFMVIDTYSRARGMVRATGQNAYDADVMLLEPLQRMALEEGIAVLCVHHNKKGAALMADSFEMLSGTMGISGSADCVCTLVTEGKRFDGKAKLECTPRDAKSFEQDITFDDALLEWMPMNKPELDRDPVCAWVLANVPKKGLIGDFASYEDCYRAVYNRCSEDCGARIREAVGQHRVELFTEYNVGVQLGVKTNGQRGLRIINMG